MDPQLPPAKAAKVGKEIRQAYMDAIDGLEKLVNGVKSAVEKRGAVKAIDGRFIKVESSHKGLNYLLQCGAGIVAKQWMLNAYDYIVNNKLNIHQLGYLHDELEYESEESCSKQFAEELTRLATYTGEQLNLRVRIDAESGIGTSWADVH